MVPPVTGVAVNVIAWPEHPGLLPPVTAIETEGATLVMLMVIALDVAVVGVTQILPGVSTQVTISLLLSVDEVNVVFVAPPIGLPFTYHWYVGVVPPLVGVAVNT